MDRATQITREADRENGKMERQTDNQRIDRHRQQTGRKRQEVRTEAGK